MKKLFLAFAVFAAMSAAQAATPEAVVNATGTVVYGTGSALVVRKDTSSGNRVAVRYPSGVQYVADDGSWTKYGKIVAALGLRALSVDGDAFGTVINVAETNGLYCQSNQSTISFPNVAQAEVLADNCNFWVKAKANAN